MRARIFFVRTSATSVEFRISYKFKNYQLRKGSVVISGKIHVYLHLKPIGYLKPPLDTLPDIITAGTIQQSATGLNQYR